MKINVTFLGPDQFANVRRDLMLLLKYSLEDLGHNVAITQGTIEAGSHLNILIGSYFLNENARQTIINSKADVVHLNTEIIKNDLLNFNPKKVDFLGCYLPFLRYGRGILDVVVDNLPEHERYGTNAAFLRWAYHEKFEELTQLPNSARDYDFYLFGMMTERRKAMVKMLESAGYRGVTHEFCTNWERNSTIERSRVNLNVLQNDIYSHVSSFRIGYLSNNRCAILSEKEYDPAGYLDAITITDRDRFLEDFAKLLDNNRYLELGQKNYYYYRKIHFTPILEEALESIFNNA